MINASVSSTSYPDLGQPNAVRGLSASMFTRPLLLVVAGVAALSFSLDARAGAAVWVVSLFVFGMPHGAYDIVVVFKESRDRGRLGPGARLAVLYTATTALCVVCLWFFPSATVVLFLLLSAHHFGVSDCVWTRGRLARSIRDHTLGFSHGIAVLSVPFFAAPVQAWEPFEAIAAACGGSLSVDPDLTRALAGAGWVFAIGIQGWAAMRGTRSVLVLEQSAVLVGSAILGLAGPPLFAVAVYFLAIHASGHCLRATVPWQLNSKQNIRNAIRVHTRSLPLLVPSIGIVFAIAITMFGEIGFRALALGFLLFCVVGTLPHHLLWTGAFHRGRVPTS